jgi:hypothetical protein
MLPAPETCGVAPPFAPTVDYADTSRRPTWSQLPQRVRAAVGRLGGGPVQTAEPPVRSGFTGSYAGRVTTASGRRLFAKAGAPEQPHVVAALTQEAVVLELLPAGIPAPRLVGFDSIDGWSVLVLEVVAGRMPGRLWTPVEVEAVHRACLTMAELGTPWRATDADLGHRLSADPDILAVGGALVDGSFELEADQPEWLGRHRERVGELVLGAEGRFDGATLCHGDLRPDNLLVTTGSAPAVATVVDWNWVGAAASWVDWVGLLPLMAAQGVDTDPLLASSPLTRDADPEAVDAFVATIAAYMLGGYRNQPPMGCTPALRRHQLLMAHVFLEFLRRRRAWPA